jgi:hypothetical protein
VSGPAFDAGGTRLENGGAEGKACFRSPRFRRGPEFIAYEDERIHATKKNISY